MIAPLRHSIIPSYRGSLGLSADVDFVQLCAKDARDIDLQDLQKIVKTIDEQENTYVILFHGLQTMVDTLKYIQEHATTIDQKTIICVGSRRPLANVTLSDAGFHVGVAYQAIQCSHHEQRGVFCSFAGKIMRVDELQSQQYQ